MPRVSLPRCNRCGCLVIWVKTESGKPLPVVPKPGGDVEVTGEADAAIGWFMPDGKGQYENHAKACGAKRVPLLRP